MLEFLRRSAKSWIAKLILGLVALSFMGWGIGDILTRKGPSQPAVRVGDVGVAVQEIATDLNRQVFRLRKMFGNQFSTEDAIKVGALDEIIKQTISRTAIDMLARQMELRVPDVLLRETIRTLPEFQDERGDFNRALFRQKISQSNWSESGFLSALRGDIRRGYITDTIKTDIHPPESLSAALYTHRHEKRKARVARIRAANMSAPESFDEEKLRSYYEENHEDFRAPEYRKLSAVFLTTEMAKQKVTPTEEEIRQFFEENKELFQTPERRHLIQMRFDKKENAEKIAKQVNNAGKKTPAAFREAAKETGREEDQLILGWVTPGVMMDAVREPIFSADPKSLIGPLKSPMGWHLFLVTDVKEEDKKKIEDVRKKIITRLKAEQAYEALYDLSMELEDALGAGEPLEEAAAQIDAAITEVEKVDPSGLNPDGEVMLREYLTTDFLETAFTLRKGETSRLREMPGGYYVVRTDQRFPSRIRAFEDVREKISGFLKHREQVKAAREKARKIAESLNAGTPFSEVAKKEELDVESTGTFSRFDDEIEPAYLKADMIGRLFATEKGGTRVIPYQKDFVVARVVDVKTPDPEENTAEFKAMRDKMKENMSGDLTSQFVASLASRYGVDVNRQVLEDTFGKLPGTPSAP